MELKVTLSPLPLETQTCITGTFTAPGSWVELGGIFTPAEMVTEGWVGVKVGVKVEVLVKVKVLVGVKVGVGVEVLVGE